MSKTMVNIGGFTQSLGAWADDVGISRATIYTRYNRGVRGEELLLPVYDDETQTLCWKCNNYAGGCSWSRNFLPVEGWTAIPTVVSSQVCVKGKQYQHYVPSFLVRRCPKFVPDPPRCKGKRNK